MQESVLYIKLKGTHIPLELSNEFNLRLALRMPFTLSLYLACSAEENFDAHYGKEE